MVRTCCASLLPAHAQQNLIDQVDLPSPTRSPANAGEVQCRHLSEHGQDESIFASKVAATLWLILTFAAGTTSRKASNEFIEIACECKRDAMRLPSLCKGSAA